MMTIAFDSIADAERQLRRLVRDRFRREETRAQLLGGDDFDPDTYDAATDASREACEAEIRRALEMARAFLSRREGVK